MVSLSLSSNKSCTFPFENQKNIYCFTVSPDGSILISVDEGKSLVSTIIMICYCLYF